jgi:hypothetical protein
VEVVSVTRMMKAYLASWRIWLAVMVTLFAEC